ncbi:MAG: type 1 glutamine amidotransferase [Pseudomonadota bacterium]
MHITILETGEPPDALQGQFPGYGQMMEKMLRPIAPAFSFSRHRVFDGEAMPPVAQVDGVLITGSAAGAYEGHGWIAPLEDFVRDCATAGRPQVGICFGHQIIAQALGGTVKKVDKGWGVGAHSYSIEINSGHLTPALGRVTCAVSHQDQVVDLPETAIRLGGSEFCPNGLLRYAHAPILTMQPHPEFTHDYARALLSFRRGRIPEERVDDGLQTLQGRSDRGAMAQWIANFYLQSR